MVKTCLSKNHGFVIVFNANNESQSDFTFSKKGSFVEIIDFNNDQLITVQDIVNLLNIIIEN